LICFRASEDFSLGLERSGGFETVAFCEIEPYCRAVLKKHWPDVPCYDDVRDVSGQRLWDDGNTVSIQVVCGGFPCQDISLAGKGAGLAGERSGLWREYARIIGDLRPWYVIVENVSALLDRGLGDVLGDLAALGYDAEWHCIPASAVGAIHARDRVWIIAHAQRDGVQRRPSVAAAWQGKSGEEQLPGLLLTRIRDAVSAARVWRACHGVPSRLDVSRNKAIGNSVYSPIPELIGKAIMQAEGVIP
jgi:DNA (cytosine-5)-methyltransferase 1